MKEEQRWNIGNSHVTVPTDWTMDTEPANHHVIQAPSGDGRLLVTEITDTMSPDITEAYAAQAGDAMLKSLGLDAVPRVQRIGEGHYAVAIESVIDGRRVLGAAHVFRPNVIVQAFFHTADPESPHFDAARQILSSIRPVRS